MVEALETRDQGTNDRVRASLDQNLGPAPVPSQVEGQFARIRADAGPRYEAALNNGPAIDTAPVLAEIGQRMNTASGPELAALQRARDMLVQTGPDGLVLPRTDPRYLHGVKGSLDQLIEYGDQQIGIPRGALSRSDNALSRVRGRLNDALESQVPGYADANLTTSTAHRASDAFRSGQEALRPNVHPYDFNQGFAAAPIEQQAAARLGMRADLDQVVGNKANDLQAVTGHLKGEGDWNQTKAGTAFGQEPVEAVLADLERQRAFRQTYGNAVGGSKTANTTMAADAVDVRAPSAGGSNADITLGTMAGGPAGTAAAVGVRGARYGLSLLGRRSDIARNDELADALVRSGGAIDPLLDAIRTRGERISSLNHNARNSTQALIEALAMSGDRNGEDKSRLEGTRAAIVKALTDGGRSSAARR